MADRVAGGNWSQVPKPCQSCDTPHQHLTMMWSGRLLCTSCSMTALKTPVPAR